MPKNPKFRYNESMLIPKSRAGQIKLLIRLASLAPSSHNTQPWNFSADKNTISVWADLSRRLPIGDPSDRELYTSLGAAIQNILSAAEALGMQPTLTLFPSNTEPTLVAQVALKYKKFSVTKNGLATLSAIETRRTNRTPYNPTRLLPPKIVSKITQLAEGYGGKLTLITARPTISQLAQMVKRGLLEFLSQAEFRQELSTWIRHDWSKKGDGLPGYSIGMPGIVSIIAPVLIRSAGPIKAVAEGEKKVIESCSTLGIITIPQDTKPWWVKTGMIFQSIALTLEVAGIATAILTSIIESPKERQKLKRIVRGEPSLFFRLGYATGPGISVPRRSHVIR